MDDAVITVRGVSKFFMLPHLRQSTLKGHVINRFRRRQTIELQEALNNIEFEVPKGEFFGVVGRNGSGKSTLLKILAGIYRPTEGEVSVSGRVVPFIELGVGFNPELSGRENVYLNGALLGFSRNEVDEIYDDIVEFAELDGYMDQKLKNYSSGMQVRIAFSVATRAKADILLVDEVLAVGDTAFQRKCFDHFRALKKSGTTIVFVTHDMNLVREFCDRAILIENSRVVCIGGGEEVAIEYTKLFNATSQTAEADVLDETPGDRWGEGDVRYVGVRVPPALVEDDMLTIELEAVATASVTDAVFGFSISDASGAKILGTTSALKRQTCGPLREGERVRIIWSVPNVFSDGVHEVELIITDRQGLAIFDSWSSAASFSVVKEEKTPYVVTPSTSLSLTRLGA